MVLWAIWVDIVSETAPYEQRCGHLRPYKQNCELGCRVQGTNYEPELNQTSLRSPFARCSYGSRPLFIRGSRFGFVRLRTKPRTEVCSRWHWAEGCSFGVLWGFRVFSYCVSPPPLHHTHQRSERHPTRRGLPSPLGSAYALVLETTSNAMLFCQAEPLFDVLSSRPKLEQPDEGQVVAPTPDPVAAVACLEPSIISPWILLSPYADQRTLGEGAPFSEAAEVPEERCHRRCLPKIPLQGLFRRCPSCH